MITYIFKNKKYIFCKDGVYFSLTKSQMEEMKKLFEVIDDVQT